MKKVTSTRVLGSGLATLLLLAAATLHAQESSTGKTSPTTDAPAPVAKKRNQDRARQVPDYFGQIGLTDEQRETIYKVQGKHLAKIDELEKQIQEIRAQMLGESEAVLTDAQKQLLTQRRHAAIAKRTAKAKAKADN